MAIVKKGEGAKVKEYRGVTLMPTLYKVYASALVEGFGGKRGNTTQSDGI